MKISLDKCQFFKREIEFLGYYISTEGLTPTTAKIQEINEFPELADSKSHERFLRMANFYRKFIPQVEDILLPLTKLIKETHQQQFTDAEKETFSSITNFLNNLTTHFYSDTDITHYYLVSDNSNYAVGAALHHMINNKPVPIGFFSNKLTEKQTKWFTFDLELFATYLVALHFKPQIEARLIQWS